MKTESHPEEVKTFTRQLTSYKTRLDEDIAAYAKTIQKSTLQNYGADSRIAVDAYLEILSRGGKRVRGALAMVGYEMMGGTDEKMILAAARALEMIHAYILIMDDIQDRSLTRRGGPTAHRQIADYHRNHHLSGDSDHFGVSVALNAMGIGNHAAQVIVANLTVDEELRLMALSILNQAIIVTVHGQTNDILNEVKSDTTMQDVDNVLEWKTAYYTFLNPLTFGMVLAGADCKATDAVREYSLKAGRAFQITDDILGVFGEEFESGKSPYDDIKEGKRTLLVVYALEHASSADKNFLIQMLGNQNINQMEFNRCRDILIDSGALAYAKNEAQKCVAQAVTSLESQDIKWRPEGVAFLAGLVQSLINRKT